MTADDRSEPRYAPTVERVYRNATIEVTWEPRYCIHFGACFRGSLAAFDPRRRPWVDVDAESPGRIAEVVRECPTGALHVRRTDGADVDVPAQPVTVEPRRNGPLFVRGRVEVRDRLGAPIRDDVRVALCRCGQSDNKPFCDGSHLRTGFESRDALLDGTG